MWLVLLDKATYIKKISLMQIAGDIPVGVPMIEVALVLSTCCFVYVFTLYTDIDVQ
jgi:hypothetical protein